MRAAAGDDVLEPALEYTEAGFPMYPGLRNAIVALDRSLGYPIIGMLSWILG